MWQPREDGQDVVPALTQAGRTQPARRSFDQRSTMTMILRCSYCGGKMRVDEKALPSGKKVKVRCPSCRGIGLTSYDPNEDGVEAAAQTRDRHEYREPSDTVAPDTQRVADLQVPSDFRFPAEGDPDAPQRRSMGKGFKMFLWAAASLGIILFFAMLVNLVLPGPPK